MGATDYRSGIHTGRYLLLSEIYFWYVFVICGRVGFYKMMDCIMEGKAEDCMYRGCIQETGLIRRVTGEWRSVKLFIIQSEHKKPTVLLTYLVVFLIIVL